MARTDGRLSRCDGQILTAINDTSFNGVCRKVSGEPTPFDEGQINLYLARSSNTCQISPTAFDLWTLYIFGTGSEEYWLPGGFFGDPPKLWLTADFNQLQSAKKS